MQKILASAVALALGLAAPIAAEQREKVTSSGSWSFYRIKDYAVASGGKHTVLPNACVAETGTEKARMAFAMFSAQDAARVPAVKGVVIGQITSPSWHFRNRTGDFVISDANINFHVKGTLYDGDMIMFNLGGDGQVPPELQALVEVVEGPLTLSDAKGAKLATFPSQGLRAMFRKMLACGGT